MSSIALEETPSGRNPVGHSVTTSLKVDCPIFYAKEESVAILGAGATANMVCFRLLRHHNELFVNAGLPAVTTYPDQATFKFGDGRTGEVCHAADFTVGVAGIKGKFTAFVLDSVIPALLSGGALEALQGCLDFVRHTLTLGANGKVIPFQVSDVGHYIWSVADFPKMRGGMHSSPSFAASLFHWAPKNRETYIMDLMKNGGVRWDEPGQVGATPVSGNFTPPKLHAAYRAVALRDAGNSDLSSPATVFAKLHVNWRHVSAAQVKRVLVDA